MDILVLLLVAAVRLAVPLTILRWPFWGGLASIAADAFDTIIQDALGVHPLEAQYHRIDKAFDVYYLAIEGAVVWRWRNSWARSTALVLLALRLLAVALFELSGARWLFLLVGPNIFENFYLFVAGMLAIDARFRIRSVVQFASILLFVGVPKILQEYVMHYREAATWAFIKETLFSW